MEAHAPQQDPHGHGHDPNLAHHFETPTQQFESGKLGMWIFLSTEVLLFSGLFCAYAIYRANHPEIFAEGHKHLNPWLGGINTVVLICSSLTMAWAVRAAQLGQRTVLITCLVLTLLGACGFLGIKYVEYKNKWEHGLLWAGQYRPGEHAAEGGAHGEAAATQTPAPAGQVPAAAASPAVTQLPSGLTVERSRIAPAAIGPAGLAEEERIGVPTYQQRVPQYLWIFFGVYFLMTGLHGLHVIGGMAAISWVLVRSVQGTFGPRYYTPVDLVGLYWHLVDVIWIFLFPLLYLIH